MNIQVLLATYNGMTYVKEQLLSILSSKLNDDVSLTVYISDDGSTQAPELVKYISGLNDPRVIMLSSERKGGVKKNFLYLMNQVDASIDLIFFADQDDVWDENKIQIFIDAYKAGIGAGLKNSEPILIHSDLRVVDKNLSEISSSMFDYQGLNRCPSFAESMIQNSVTGCVMAINQKLLSMLSASNVGDAIMHDWYASMIAQSLGKVIFIDKPTIMYRQHGGNQVGAKNNNILLRLRDVGAFISDASSSIANVEKQAALFYKEFGDLLTSEDRYVVEAFLSSFGFKNIIKRLHLFLFFKLRKSGLYRNVGFFVFYVLLGFHGR